MFRNLFFSQINFQKNIIHLHGFQKGKHLLFLLFLMLFFNKKVIVTIHNDRFLLDYNSLKNIQKIIAKIFYFNISHIISVNSDSKFGFIPDNKISVIPAFIPPTSDETEVKQLPDFFHKIRYKHKFLITANAFRISFYKNQDLYGIDLSIELMKRLIDNGYKDIGFIYVIPDIGDYDYFKKMQNLVKKYTLEDNFYFYTKPVAYPAVINMCDLFIRPTNTDGDALSIREALTLQKPTIASDVCRRPEGTILFKKRNVNDLYNKVIYIIENYIECKKQIESIEFEDNAEKILEVYKKVLNGE
jgi:glycosyltransferase involved in cell wall biosynthesis